MANQNSVTIELDQFQGNENSTMELLPCVDLGDLLDYTTNALSLIVGTNHLVASATCDLRVGDVKETEIQCWDCGQWVLHYNYCSKCGSKIINMQERASMKLVAAMVA